MLELPLLPSTIRPLSDPEYERLRRLYPRLWSDPHRACLTCSKQGTLLTIQGEMKCDCLAQWLLHLYLLNSGVLLSYQRITWADLDDQVPVSVVTAVREYIEHSVRYINAGLGMVLHGTPGTGKTLLASLLLKRLLGEGHDGYFTQFNHLLDAYAAGWRDKEDRDWFTRRVANAGVLVIDDIGKERRNKVELPTSLFDMVIRNRVADDKPTIITTNYSKEEMQNGYGGPVMSLLSESVIFHEVTGTDFRESARLRSLAETREDIVRPVTLGHLVSP